MKFMNFLLINFVLVIFAAQSYASQNKPWSQRHFPNVPRITAEQALMFQKTGAPCVIIDVAWSQKGFKSEHICGAIGITTAQLTKKFLDRMLKKIPKKYTILSY